MSAVSKREGGVFWCLQGQIDMMSDEMKCHAFAHPSQTQNAERLLSEERARPRCSTLHRGLKFRLRHASLACAI